MDRVIKNYEKFLNFELYLQKELQQNDVLSSLFCGGIAGIMAKTVIAPLERIKMSFQISREHFSYKLGINRFLEVYKNQGFLALWNGHSTTVLRVGPYAALSYAFHDYSEAYFKKQLGKEQLPVMYKFLAGSIGGVAGTLLTYPLDVIRVRLIVSKNATWKDSLHWGSNRLALYQGVVPTVIGIIPYAGTAWCCKQTLLEFFPFVTHRRPYVLESLFINALAGLCGQFVTYPLDVVRRRMQIAQSNGHQKLPSFLFVIRELAKTEGLRGLFKGFTLNIVKGPLSLSVSLTTYDILQKYTKEVRCSSKIQK